MFGDMRTACNRPSMMVFPVWSAQCTMRCFHGFGAMLAEVADSLDVVVMVPGNQNVLFQIFGVVRVGTIDDAALRQRGIAAVQLFSGDNEGYLIPGVRQSKGGRAAADPGADDENLCFQALLCHTAFF